MLGYEGRAITDKLNFSVEKGDYLCIVGENGAGKSTLINALLGLKAPMSGEIITDEGISAEDIGYLPQQTAARRDFPASVREIVSSGCAGRLGFRPFYSKSDKLRAEDAMRRLGLSGISNRCFRELSGGQQRRVLLARALCAARRIILLDEPAAGLDPIAMQEMYEVIQKLNNDGGMTVIMVSHDIDFAVKYSKHILHIGKERMFFGTPDEYLASDTGKTFADSMRVSDGIAPKN